MTRFIQYVYSVPEAVTANLYQIAVRNSLVICVEVIGQIKIFLLIFFRIVINIKFSFQTSTK